MDIPAPKAKKRLSKLERFNLWLVRISIVGGVGSFVQMTWRLIQRVIS